MTRNGPQAPSLRAVRVSGVPRPSVPSACPEGAPRPASVAPGALPTHSPALTGTGWRPSGTGA